MPCIANGGTGENAGGHRSGNYAPVADDPVAALMLSGVLRHTEEQLALENILRTGRTMMVFFNEASRPVARATRTLSSPEGVQHEHFFLRPPDYRLRSVVWWTSMACNFKCKYCWEVQAQERGEFKPIPFKPAGEWLAVWNRLKPTLLDITGGEPFLMPDLVDLLTGLDPSIRVGLTSNLSHPLLEFARQVSPERVVSIAASFHPTENGTRQHPMNPEIFVGRCLFLQTRGFRVTVNCVAWPEQMYLIPAWAEMFRSHDLRFHVDPYSPIAYYPYEYSEAERKFLEPWVVPNRQAGLQVLQPVEPVVVNCSGGVGHLNVQHDGSAWRCILERQLGINPLGNVFDPSFQLLDAPRECRESWRCPACDRDKVKTVPASTNFCT